MKKLIALPLVLLSLNTYALNGFDLLAAKDNAFMQAEVEIDLHEVEGWEANLEGEEVEVSIQAHEELLSYGCDMHGSEIVCHEEGDHHLKDDEHNAMDEATEAGLKKLAKSLGRKDADLSVLNGLKVWKEEDADGHGHGHNDDFWIKASYELKNVAKVTYIQCHTHGEDGLFFCHYKAKPSNEPVFEAH